MSNKETVFPPGSIHTSEDYRAAQADGSLRRSGKSLAIFLRAAAAAIDAPGTWFPVVDHFPMRPSGLFMNVKGMISDRDLQKFEAKLEGGTVYIRSMWFGGSYK